MEHLITEDTCQNAVAFPVRCDRILQPDCVTFAEYNFSPLQYDILLHIKEELQFRLIRNPQDLFQQRTIRVPLNCLNFEHFNRNRKAFYHYLKEFFVSQKNTIDFSWKYKKDSDEAKWMLGLAGDFGYDTYKEGEIILQNTNILSSVIYGSTSKIVYVTLNPLVVPFLLYIGDGMSCTEYDSHVAYTLKSFYSKRIHEWICKWSRTGMVVPKPISEIKRELKLYDSYDNRHLKCNIISVAQREIEKSASPVKIEKFEFVYDPELDSSDKSETASGKIGRKMANTVIFTLRFDKGSDLKTLLTQQLQLLLKDIADPEKLSLCNGLAMQIVNNGQGVKLRNKFLFYGKRLKSGGCSKDYYRNTLLKIVRESTGTDLRSDSHIRNAMILERKHIKDVTVGLPSLF